LNYPYVPPVCYVVPTANMQVKPQHRLVEQSGLVGLQSLLQFRPNNTLVEALSLMASAFSEDPPVFSVAGPPQGNVQPPQPVKQPDTPSSYPYSNLSSNPQAQPPPYVHPAPHQSLGASIAPTGNFPSSTQPHLQPPPRGVNPNSSGAGGAWPPEDNSFGLASRGQPAANHNSKGADAEKRVSLGGSGAAVGGNGTATISGGSNRAALKAGLVVQMTALLASLSDTASQRRRQEIHQLMEAQQQLATNKDALVQGKAAIEREAASLTQATQQLAGECASLENWLQAHEGKEAQSMDGHSCVYFLDSHTTQLYDCVAEDHALEDALYCLDRLLQDEKIELKEFLKETRKLARKQFLARALAQKITSIQRGLCVSKCVCVCGFELISHSLR
jgi:ESCRT-I complex subunit TSG101